MTTCQVLALHFEILVIIACMRVLRRKKKSSFGSGNFRTNDALKFTLPKSEIYLLPFFPCPTWRKLLSHFFFSRHIYIHIVTCIPRQFYSNMEHHLQSSNCSVDGKSGRRANQAFDICYKHALRRIKTASAIRNIRFESPSLWGSALVQGRAPQKFLSFFFIDAWKWSCEPPVDVSKIHSKFFYRFSIFGPKTVPVNQQWQCAGCVNRMGLSLLYVFDEFINISQSAWYRKLSTRKSDVFFEFFFFIAFLFSPHESWAAS